MAKRIDKYKVLLIDDEESIRTTLADVLRDEGFHVITAPDAESGIESVEDRDPDIVLLDIWLPGMDGLEALKVIKERAPDLPVVMISGHGSVEAAVEATKSGAFDFIEKPLSIDKVALTIEHALELTRLSREYKLLKREMFAAHELIGDSRPIRDLREQIEKIGPTEGWVLITGDNGTGKELVARSIHARSARKDEPFVGVNCAAIPEELIESELFGYEKGAFTGAEGRKPGKFDMANNGAVFLDEIADMSMKTQAKILRILQEQQFERVGGTRPVKVDVRVIAATNKDLEQAMKDGAFREDLYYRLNVIPLHVPSLRERKEDIPLFVDHFIEEFCARSRLPKKSIHKNVMTALKRYAWPGNVRELKNVIERMVILSSGDEIKVKDLPTSVTSPGGAVEDSPYNIAGLKDARAAFEREYLIRKLIENDYNISRTAEQVGMERTTLHRKIKSYKIEIEK